MSLLAVAAAPYESFHRRRLSGTPRRGWDVSRPSGALVR